jgi:hypothetical protein
MLTCQLSYSPYHYQDAYYRKTKSSQEIAMTTEKQRYSGYITRRVRTALFSQVVVSMGMIGSALIMLEKLV